MIYFYDVQFHYFHQFFLEKYTKKNRISDNDIFYSSLETTIKSILFGQI